MTDDPNTKETLDLEQTFMLYAAFCGDVAKTAHSSGIPKEQVIALADQYGWRDRIQGLVVLARGEKAGDVERAINRAMNFVQAHRCRHFIERVLRALVTQADESNDVLEILRTDRVSKDGKVVGQAYSTRPLADLTSAMEKIHWMTYQALNDSPQERAKRVEKVEDEVSQSDIHARISTALAAMRSQSPKDQLESGQQELANHLALPARAAAPPPPPPLPPAATGARAAEAAVDGMPVRMSAVAEFVSTIHGSAVLSESNR